MRTRNGLLTLRPAALCFVLLIAALPWAIAPMSVAAIATAVLTLAAWFGSERPRWPRTGVDPAWMAWTLALCLAVAFAVDPTASWPRLKKALLPGLVAIAGLHTPDRRVGRRALAVLFASSAVAAVYGTVFFVAKGASFAARSRGAAGHYMTFAGQLLILVAVAVPVALLARRRRWRIGAAACALVGAVAIAGTFTRSAWIGLGVAIVTSLSIIRPRLLLVTVALLVGIVALAPSTYRDRLTSAFDPHHPMNLERTYMWQAGIRMFLSHPVTGVGLQDLKPIYERYKSPEARERAGHLHSVPIQIAATMGVVGLVAFAWLYGSLLVAAGSRLRATLREPDVEAGLKVGVISALIGFFVAGLFEWNFGDEELLYLLYTVVGLAWSAGRWSTARDPE